MKEWAVSVCLAVITGCIIRMMIPKGDMGKIINFSMSIFLLSIMFSGILFEDFNFQEVGEFFEQKEDVQKVLEELKQQSIIGEIEKRIIEKLRYDLLINGINPIKIYVNINMNEKSSILINRMEIFIKKEERSFKEKIREIVKYKYEIEPDIKES